MKLFKKIAILSMALTFCLCAGASLTACGGNGETSSSTQTESNSSQTAEAYEFVILNADGTPAQGVMVQLCVLGNSAACFMPVATNENGKATYNPMAFPGQGEYEIHLYNAEMTTALEFTGVTTTPTTFEQITLTLK